jgi:tetratricopeptide (TPR) repeat protein
LDWIETALDIEPLSLILNANKGYLLYIARSYDESITQLKKTLEIDPTFAATHYRLGLACGARGMHREAIRHLREAQRFSDDSPQALGALGYFFGLTGDKAAAHEILRRLAEISKSRYVSATIMAEVLTGLGLFTEALAWLERAVPERAGALVTFRVDPRFDRLRSEPRCQQVLLNLGAST